VLFVGGLCSVFAPNAPRIYIGALLVGPLLFARGVYFLRHHYRNRDALGPLKPPPGTATELYEDELRQGTPPKEVTCEACGLAYVYFPGKAARAQAVKLGPEVADLKTTDAILHDCAVAPCPSCGWIQAEMVPYARQEATLPLLAIAGMIILCFSAIFFLYVMSAVVSPAMQRHEEDCNASTYWLANAAFLLVGLGLLGWGWRRSRDWNPNGQSVKKRLRLSQQVSLSREVYEQVRARANTEA
jgi:hypothetical protein